MKVIIAGSRSITDLQKVEDAVKQSGFSLAEVVSGEAKGVDSLAMTYAKDNGISIKGFPAQWGRYGRSAGAIRNKEMAQYADALIAIWDGESLGTAHMIQQGHAFGLQVYIHNDL